MHFALKTSDPHWIRQCVLNPENGVSLASNRVVFVLDNVESMLPFIVCLRQAHPEATRLRNADNAGRA